MKIILGSQSRFRAQALREAGIEVDECISPGIDEKAIRCDDPEKLVLALAKAKAEAIVDKIDGPAILITADQVVVCNGEMREKPQSREEATRFLASYVDHPAEIINGIMVTNTATGAMASGIDIASVQYNKSLLDETEMIVDNSFAMESAGGLVLENPLMKKHEVQRERTVDSFFGMPIDLVKRLIEEVR